MIIAGPTASGKTALAVELAGCLDAEIISADSRQVYRRLDAGTAKPTVDECRGVGYHLLDLIDLGERYSAGRFARDAREVLERIEQRGKTPIICGGTGFYLEALVRPLFTEPEIDPQLRLAIRARLKQEVISRGRQALHDRLREVDPASAARLHPHDFQRVGRALELYESTGRTMSAFHAEAVGSVEFTPFMVVLEPESGWHEDRIAGRIDWMLGHGWVEEVELLLEEGVSGREPGMESLGYAEVAELVKGESDPGAAAAKIALKTRQYARRQCTWFKARNAALRIDPLELEVGKVLSAWSEFNNESGRGSD